jgi:serine/threonine-protein kinase
LTDTLSRLQDLLAGAYRLERELGRGGMATVFLAHDLRHDRPVALKVLHPELAATLGPERFLREIKLAARLQHPHILTVLDSGVSEAGTATEGRRYYWFTMPYVEGENLRDRLERETQLPVEVALRLAGEAAQALEYAHTQGVIHRDIKPENLLITRDGDLLVADFGVARTLANDEQRLTETGMAVGTPAYMSPEQSTAGRTLDARTDVYALGAVLYEMLAGEPPFTGPTAQVIIAKRMRGTVPSVRTVRPAISEAVDQVVRRALAPVPADRFGTMAELRIAIDRLRAGGGEALRSTPRTRIVAAGAALVVVLIAAGGVLLLRGRSESGGSSLPNTAAVLPFSDLSPGSDQGYFSDGLTEELTTTLARIPGLRVVARTSAFQFRGAKVDVRDVGRRLRVGAVLGGTVRRSGNRLRVSAQLVNTRDGYELWSASYDRDVADVFQVQEEIARAIGTALSVRLAGGSDSSLRQHPTSDLEAYDLYLKGRFAWHQRTETTLLEAARYFEQAVGRDSSFSRAWAGLADAYVLLPIYTPMPPHTAWPRARTAANRAISLDPRSAEAYTSLAYGTMLYDWDWAGSERAFQLALTADSTYPTAHHWYADFLAGRGRFEESLTEMRRAHELDPLSRITGAELAWVYYLLRRPAEADSTLAEVLRLDPGYAHAHLVLGLLRLSQGRPREAVQALRHSMELGGFNPHGAGALIAALTAGGDRAAARAELDALTNRARSEYVPPFAFVVAYTWLGEMDRAYQFLDRGIAERDGMLPECFFEPLLEPLVRDPRYARVEAVFR